MAAVRHIVLPYAPRRAFLRFHERSQRWAVIVAHRRAGKTVACINDLARRAITCDKPDGRFAYVAPLFNQAKDVAWQYLKHFTAPMQAGPPNESELRIDLLNGARIRLYGADNPDRLRGIYLDHVILDEYADMSPSVWGSVIRPLLADRQGGATFIGTPKGRNAFFDIWQRAQKQPDWLPLMLKASETGILPADELEAARADMTPEQYEQEFECSFEAAITGAYYGREMAEAERAGRICNVPYDPALPVHTAWDLGIGDATAVWFWQAHRGEIRVIDFYQNSGYALEHYAEVLEQRGYRYGDDWVPHDAKARSLSTGRTRVETLAMLRRKPRVVADHRVDDGINSLRVLFPAMFWDKDKCADGLEALRQYRAEYDEKTRAFRDRPRHDWTSHPADAARYMAMAYRELTPAPTPPPGKTMQTLTINELWSAQRPQRERRI